MKRNPTGFVHPLLLFSLIGCGGDVVPVAGRVTLDEEPLAEVQVVFEPIEGLPEDTSTGETDAQGRYTLRRLDGSSGALVGEHRVKLTTLKPDLQADERTPVPRDRIPPQHRAGSLTFTVPEDGTSSADFALQSR